LHNDGAKIWNKANNTVKVNVTNNGPSAAGNLPSSFMQRGP
jgi:hypothetical protein